MVKIQNNPWHPQSEKHMHLSYLRYLENKIRDTFEFEGAPIKFVLRKKED